MNRSSWMFSIAVVLFSISTVLNLISASNYREAAANFTLAVANLRSSQELEPLKDEKPGGIAALELDLIPRKSGHTLACCNTRGSFINCEPKGEIVRARNGYICWHEPNETP